MEQARPSRTLQIPAIMRALHQTLDDEPKILLDPIAPRLLDPDDDREWLAPLLLHPFARQWRAGFALRARYGEDCLADAVHRGVRQYVILGAGLDTFAFRQPAWGSSLRIYELDHPQSQAWKRDRLKAAAIAVPENLTFVPVDFESTSIANALGNTEFAPLTPTFCSWMGVSQYLTLPAIDATLSFFLSLARTSEVVLSFILPQEDVTGVEAEALAVAAERAAAIGEPWITRLTPDALAERLRARGFSQVIHLTPAQIHARYFRERRDGLRERHGEQLMRAIV